MGKITSSKNMINHSKKALTPKQYYFLYKKELKKTAILLNFHPSIILLVDLLLP